MKLTSAAFLSSSAAFFLASASARAFSASSRSPANLLRIGLTSSRLKTKFWYLASLVKMLEISPSLEQASPSASGPSCRWIDSFPPRRSYLQGGGKSGSLPLGSTGFSPIPNHLILFATSGHILISHHSHIRLHNYIPHLTSQLPLRASERSARARARKSSC